MLKTFSIGFRARSRNKTPAQVLFCEFCEIIKNIYSVEHLRMTASELQPILKVCLKFL